MKFIRRFCHVSQGYFNKTLRSSILFPFPFVLISLARSQLLAIHFLLVTSNVYQLANPAYLATHCQAWESK